MLTIQMNAQKGEKYNLAKGACPSQVKLKEWHINRVSRHKTTLMLKIKLSIGKTMEQMMKMPKITK